MKFPLLLAALYLLSPAVPRSPSLGVENPPAREEPQKQPVYDEAARGEEQIAAALERARRENKRVLIQWGANWCGWCVKLAGTFQKDAEVARELMYEYELVKLDVGRFDKHVELFQRYGADLKAAGIPYLTVLDAEGKVLANQETGSLEDPSTKLHDPAKVLAFLKRHEAAPLDAQALYGAALARAKQEEKRVFLHFGAPWCGWCHRLEDWMRQPEVAERLAKDFVDLKIDQDRMQHGAELKKRFPASEKGGIPWFAFLDGDGRVLADSVGSKGNVGFPAAPEEIAHFRAMLDKVRVGISPADVDWLVKSLEPKKKDG
jgi:thiol:disulfide interchange protein